MPPSATRHSRTKGCGCFSGLTTNHQSISNPPLYEAGSPVFQEHLLSALEKWTRRSRPRSATPTPFGPRVDVPTAKAGRGRHGLCPPTAADSRILPWTSRSGGTLSARHRREPLRLVQIPDGGFRWGIRFVHSAGRLILGKQISRK